MTKHAFRQVIVIKLEREVGGKAVEGEGERGRRPNHDGYRHARNARVSLAYSYK